MTDAIQMTHAVADVIEHHVGQPVADATVVQLADILRSFLMEHGLNLAEPVKAPK